MRKLRKARVFCGDRSAGILEETGHGYRFTYFPEYCSESAASPVSFTMPVKKEPYESGYLFPFFFGLLPEGSNKETLIRKYRLDETDYFGLLLVSAQGDTIGNIKIQPEE